MSDYLDKSIAERSPDPLHFEVQCMYSKYSVTYMKLPICGEQQGVFCS
jgi:hypothetical protein